MRKKIISLLVALAMVYTNMSIPLQAIAENLETIAPLTIEESVSETAENGISRRHDPHARGSISYILYAQFPAFSNML